MSTVALAACFMIWTVFSIIGVRIQRDFGLNATQFGLLVGMPVLTGALSRLPLGILADRIGGRLVYTAVMLIAAATTWLMASRSEEHTSELQSLMRISYAVFCLQKTNRPIPIYLFNNHHTCAT